MAREDPQFKLRMPEDLHAQIAAAAEKSGRSMNAEIVKRLADSLGPDNFAGQPLFSRRPPTKLPGAIEAETPYVAGGIEQLVRVTEFAGAVERFNTLSAMPRRSKEETEALKRIIERWGDPPSWMRGKAPN